jgi:hypothetical protein
MTIRSEDGLTHDWDRSDPAEWSSAGTDMLGVIALIVVATGFTIALFGGTVPVVLPVFAAGVAVYVASIIRKARR